MSTRLSGVALRQGGWRPLLNWLAECKLISLCAGLGALIQCAHWRLLQGRKGKTVIPQQCKHILLPKAKNATWQISSMLPKSKLFLLCLSLLPFIKRGTLDFFFLFSNLKQAIVIWEEGASAKEKMTPSDWPVSKFVGCFLEGGAVGTV